MEIKRFAALIRKQWWIVALVTLVAMVSAYGISKSMTPKFRASVTLGAGASVGGNGNASQYISLGQGGLLSQYALELNSLKMADAASQALKLDMPAEKLRAEITAVPTPQNLSIEVDVQDSDPNRAKAIANEVATLFVQQKQEQATSGAAVLGSLNDSVLVTVIDPAVTPTAPVSPKTKVNVAAAAVLGVVIGLLVIFLLDWLDDTVRSTEEAETLLDTRILAAIPRTHTTGSKKSTAPANGKREDSVSSMRIG